MFKRLWSSILELTVKIERNTTQCCLILFYKKKKAKVLENFIVETENNFIAGCIKKIKYRTCKSVREKLLPLGKLN